MVDASKILTVSYGTFSCTLEGFDDPFSTMRGIAEYFRDLAAEDRYFGAEPPTPDTEMLHRIAEREVQKRVEARVEDGGITLRQVEEEPNASLTASDAVTAAAVVATTVAEPEFVEDQPQDITPPVPGTESVAEKLARIRALSVEDEFESGTEIGGAAEVEEMADAPSISSVFDDADDEYQVDASEPDEEMAEQADEPETSEIQETDDVDATEEAELLMDVETEDEAEAFDDGDDFEQDADDDAPLHVVADASDDDDADEAMEEETQADDDVAEFDSEETLEMDVDLDVTEDEVDDVETEDDFEEIEESDNVISSIMGASFDQDTDEETDFDAPEATDAPDGAAIARVVKMRRSDFEAAQDVGEQNIHAAFDAETETEAEFEAEVEDDDVMDVEEDELMAHADEMSDEAKDFSAPDAEQSDAEEAEDDQSSLSDEDEADLMATLEAVKRQEAADMRSEKEGRAILENQDIENSNDSVTRILDVTNTELEETEGTRRRSAIAHLKAAVAATKADKLLGRLRGKEVAEEMDKYRDDLAKAVRPKRPTANTDSSTRRLAPLVLVSEQRIDEEEQDIAVEANAEMVLPRRVSSGNLALDEDEPDGENIFRDGHSFADFAAEMGAKELPDLLEAAAAFSSFIEGREHFSRPQIMKAVADMNEDEEYTREESLRSFGLLLRRGKIKKIKRGQFTIADTTRFNPEVRAVGE